MAKMSELEKLPSSWRDLLEVARDIFSKSAPNPHDGRRYERPADARIDFDFDPDPGVWARVDQRDDKYCVRVSLGAYLRLHGLALLLCKTKNRVNLINADRCIETSILSRHAARLFESKTLRALVDVILDVFNAVSFEEPIDQFSPFGSESETMTFYGLYFLVFHEFGHYWAGHFSLQNDSEARLRAETAVRDNGTGSLWRVLEVQADMAGGDSVADLVLAAP